MSSTQGCIRRLGKSGPITGEWLKGKKKKKTSIPKHGLRTALIGLGHGLGQVPGLCHASVSPK